MTNLNPGSILPNGATVLHYRQRDDKRVVLATWRQGELVTWQVDADGNAYWGHYFRPGADDMAMQDFENR